MKDDESSKERTRHKGKFALASAIVDVRKRAGFTQGQLAKKMGTTQPVVARLESGRACPSIRTLERLAEATGSRLLVSFEMRDPKKEGNAPA